MTARSWCCKRRRVAARVRQKRTEPLAVAPVGCASLIPMLDLTYALAEEIGDPDLFVGRKQELARLLKWAEGTKRR